MIFKNFDLLKKDEQRELKRLFTASLIKYKCDPNKHNYKMDFIEVSRRLKTSGGMATCKTINGKKKLSIAIALNVYNEFGFDRIKKAFLHETAHIIEFILYGRSGHSERFKKICFDLGGSMNKKMAGLRYAECATNDFIKPVYNHKYTCNCGAFFHKKNKATLKFLTSRCCSVCHSRLSSFKYEKV